MNFFKKLFCKKETVKSEPVVKPAEPEKKPYIAPEVTVVEPEPVKEEPKFSTKKPYGDKKFYVLLDNGHAKSTPGKCSPKLPNGERFYEWEFNRDVVKRIAVGLEKLGIKYHILSNEDMTVEVYHCDYLGENGRVTIPATITNDGVEYTVIQIGGWSFSGRTNLKSIDFPPTITSIGPSAFYACSFSEINLPSSLKNIYAGAFAECDSLREVLFPEGLVSIGGLGFADCQNLEHIEIPSTVTYIGGGAFRFSALKSVDIPGSVKEVNGFGSCGHLTEVTLHEGTTSIGDGAFNTGSLKEMRLPSTINYIGMMAFNELDDIYIPCPNPPSGSRGQCSAYPLRRKHRRVPSRRQCRCREAR